MEFGLFFIIVGGLFCVALGVTGFTGVAGIALTDTATGKHYYYTETTVHGWLPGEVPQEFMDDIREGAFDILPIIDAASSELAPPLYDDDAESGQQQSPSLSPGDALS